MGEEYRRGLEGEEICRSPLSYGHKIRRRVQKAVLVKSFHSRHFVSDFAAASGRRHRWCACHGWECRAPCMSTAKQVGDCAILRKPVLASFYAAALLMMCKDNTPAQ